MRGGRTLTSSLVLVAMLLLSSACRSEARGASGTGSTNPAAGEESAEQPYRIEVDVPELAEGDAGEARVSFVATSGYHWNEKYPASLSFDESSEVVSIEEEHRELDKEDFSSDGDDAYVTIPLRASSTGDAKLSGHAKFSVCDEDTCLIEEADVALQLEVTD